MWDMSEPSHPASGCFLRIQQTKYYDEERSANALELMPDVSSLCQISISLLTSIQHRILEKSELVPGTAGGETFKTITIDVPTYLQWLMAKFLGNGGQLKRVQVQHIAQAAAGSHAREADAVVVCAGLGSRFLGKYLVTV
jgi:D-aspartate oxidase